jgi:hypothetical protein
MSKHAYIDETFRDPSATASGYYQLTAVLLDAPDLQVVRAQTLAISPGTTFHTSKLNNQGRSDLVEAMLEHVAQTPCWNLITVTSGHDEVSQQESARQRCLSKMLVLIDSHKIRHVVADSREANLGPDPQVRNRKDLNTLRTLRQTQLVDRHMTLQHQHDWAEPMLAVPDAVGWAYRQSRLRGHDHFWDLVADVTTVHEA